MFALLTCLIACVWTYNPCFFYKGSCTDAAYDRRLSIYDMTITPQNTIRESYMGGLGDGECSVIVRNQPVSWTLPLGGTPANPRIDSTCPLSVLPIGKFAPVTPATTYDNWVYKVEPLQYPGGNCDAFVMTREQTFAEAEDVCDSKVVKKNGWTINQFECVSSLCQTNPTPCNAPKNFASNCFTTGISYVDIEIEKDGHKIVDPLTITFRTYLDKSTRLGVMELNIVAPEGHTVKNPKVLLKPVSVDPAGWFVQSGGCQTTDKNRCDYVLRAKNSVNPTYGAMSGFAFFQFDLYYEATDLTLPDYEKDIGYTLNMVTHEVKIISELELYLGRTFNNIVAETPEYVWATGTPTMMLVNWPNATWAQFEIVDKGQIKIFQVSSSGWVEIDASAYTITERTDLDQLGIDPKVHYKDTLTLAYIIQTRPHEFPMNEDIVVQIQGVLVKFKGSRRSLPSNRLTRSIQAAMETPGLSLLVKPAIMDNHNPTLMMAGSMSYKEEPKTSWEWAVGIGVIGCGVVICFVGILVGVFFLGLKCRTSKTKGYEELKRVMRIEA